MPKFRSTPNSTVISTVQQKAIERLEWDAERERQGVENRICALLDPDKDGSNAKKWCKVVRNPDTGALELEGRRLTVCDGDIYFFSVVDNRRHKFTPGNVAEFWGG